MFEGVLDGPDGVFFGPVSEASVQEAERELGVSFPSSYRSFLRTYGAGQALGLELFGLPDTRNLPHEDVRFLHVVPCTQSWRNHIHAGGRLPHDLIFVAHDDDGIDFLLDTSSFDYAECPVLLQAANIPRQKFASNYKEFLGNMRFDPDPYLKYRLRGDPPR